MFFGNLNCPLRNAPQGKLFVPFLLADAPIKKQATVVPTG